MCKETRALLPSWLSSAVMICAAAPAAAEVSVDAGAWFEPGESYTFRESRLGTEVALPPGFHGAPGADQVWDLRPLVSKAPVLVLREYLPPDAGEHGAEAKFPGADVVAREVNTAQAADRTWDYYQKTPDGRLYRGGRIEDSIRDPSILSPCAVFEPPLLDL